jgi:rubrerythrin
MDLNLFSTLDADASAVESRRTALSTVTRLGGAALLSMMPFGLAREARAQSAGNDADILNYALTLEYLEASFYNQGVASGVIAAADRPLFQTIQRDENAHVAFLRSALTAAGATPVSFTDDAFDFTADGAFNPFSDYPTFLILSQAFEDTGVRAYKGQAASITNKDYLTAALQIHSVEARHAAAVRRVRDLQGWIPNSGSDAPAPIVAVYGAGQTRRGVTDSSPAEGNLTQGGVNLSTALSGYTDEEISEAFDEPLGTATVKNIADPFVIPDLG